MRTIKTNQICNLKQLPLWKIYETVNFTHSALEQFFLFFYFKYFLNCFNELNQLTRFPYYSLDRSCELRGQLDLSSGQIDLSRGPHDLQKVDLNLFSFPLEVVSTLNRALEDPNRFKDYTYTKKNILLVVEPLRERGVGGGGLKPPEPLGEDTFFSYHRKKLTIKNANKI